ncbi:hypothetical protein [Actinomadura sp. NPDC000600]|uniref:hypothetical protein n=1 Tax=Actinomadura sp. NPDC000600 TaxID=3154262 RepID=UPI0033910EFC
MHAVFLACAAQAVYIVAYVLFKTAMGRVSPVSGRHPLHTAGRLARSPRWLAGLLVLMAGFGLSATALVSLPVAATLPAYGLGLVLLLAVGMSGFGERPTTREWLAVLITVAAMVTAALSVLPGHGGEAPDRAGEAAAALPLWKAALVFVPSLAVPLWMFSVRDRPVGGRHARPLTGIAYGLGAGVLLGATEVFGEGMAMMLAAGRGADVPLSPHPYLFLLAGVLGVGLLSIGLQRCRLTVIVTVVTVTAKTHLLLSATLLYAEPWPRESGPFWLRAAGVGLAVLALLAFPRHERRTASTSPDQTSHHETAGDRTPRDRTPRGQTSREWASSAQASRGQASRAQTSRDQTPRDRSFRARDSRDQASRDRTSWGWASRDSGEPREVPPVLPTRSHPPSLPVSPVPGSRPGGTPPSRLSAPPRGWPVTPDPARNRESEPGGARPSDVDPGGTEQDSANPTSTSTNPGGACPSGAYASGVRPTGVHGGDAEPGNVNLVNVKIQWG